MNIFRKTSRIRRLMRPLQFTEFHYLYYRKRFTENKRKFKWFSLATFGVILFEITAPLYLDHTFRLLSYQLNPTLLVLALGILIVILGGYLFLNYHSIRLKKQIGLNVINTVREDWIKYYLNRRPLGMTVRDQGNLYVKISYHLSLFQLGLGSSLLDDC